MQVPPAWGWKIPYAGRAAHVTAAPEYQATTTQVCGLFPYVAGSGTPAVGTPVGRHQLWGEVVCLDPLAWLRAGLVTNPGEFVLGQPGTGKSTLVKRQITGAVATGTRAIILGDTKPDYTLLTEHLGGQVIRIGRGLDRINPLDAGPLGAALRRMSGADAQALRWEVRSRRLSLLMALCTLIREARITNAEEVILGRAIDLLDERNRRRPAHRHRRPGGHRGRPGHPPLRRPRRHPGRVPRPGRRPGLHPRPAGHRQPGRGVRPAHLPADRPGRPGRQRGHQPGRRSRRQAAHRRDAVRLVLRVRDGRRGGSAGRPAASRRGAPTSAVMDELWRALRGAPGLVEYADSLTRLNRAKGMGTIMITHSPRRPGRPADRGGPRQSPRVR